MTYQDDQNQFFDSLADLTRRVEKREAIEAKGRDDGCPKPVVVIVR
jgi:hypothetical protein